MKYLVFSLAISTLYGCGRPQTTQVELKDAVLGAGLGASSVISGAAKATALRICYTFKSKNSTFRTNAVLGSKFKYTLDYEDCAGKNIATNKNLTTTLVQSNFSGPLTYKSSNKLPYLKIVQTHLHGELASICDSLLTGKEVSDTIILNSEQKKQIRFSTTDSNDHFKISIATKSVNNKGQIFYKVDEDYTYYVNTSASAAENRKGIVREYSFRKDCAGAFQEESLFQVLQEESK